MGTRWFISILTRTTLVLVAGLALLHLPLLASRLVYQAGVNHMHDSQWESAVSAFDRAEEMLPEFMVRLLGFQDLERIREQRGNSRQEMALSAWKINRDHYMALSLYLQSRSDLERVTRAEPLNYDPAYALARTEAGLEMLFPLVFRDAISVYNAAPLFQRAIALKPNGVEARYAQLRYLYQRGETKEIPGLVRVVLAMYPPAYPALSKEAFFVPALFPQALEGLEQALAAEICPRAAHQGISDILLRSGHPDRAIVRYEQSLGVKSFINDAEDFLHLGRLYLAAGKVADSQGWFARGLSVSSDFKAALERVYHFHERHRALTGFIRFAQTLESMADPRVELLMARAWRRLGRDDMARNRLRLILAQAPNARAHAMLAEIAESQRAWPKMEAQARSAVKLRRDVGRYHYLLAKALARQKQYTLALESVNRALARAEKISPWYYNQRAWIHWGQQSWDAAARDWFKAHQLMPGHGEFLFLSARAHQRDGHPGLGLVRIRQALTLAADSADRKRYLMLARRLEGGN